MTCFPAPCEGKEGKTTCTSLRVANKMSTAEAEIKNRRNIKTTKKVK